MAKKVTAVSKDLFSVALKSYGYFTEKKLLLLAEALA